MARRVRYALVGAGNIAQVAVLPAFAHAKENSELVAIVDPDEDKLRVLGERYGVERLGGPQDLERILAESRADAIYLAVPNHLHREYTERAAKAGVHVLCEKPMAPTVADCEAMMDAVERAGVKLMIAYRLHFEESNLEAIAIARSGKLGEPKLLSATLSQKARLGDIRLRADVAGGALLDTGIYCVNAARYLFDAEPVEVSAMVQQGGDPDAPGVDETTVALLRFPGGRLAYIACSQVAAPHSAFDLVGDEGSVRLESAFSYTERRRRVLTVGEDKDVRVFPEIDQFAPELFYFSRCILEDEEPEPSGIEGLADIRVIEALFESARTGRSVRLDPFDLPRRPSPDQVIVRPAIEPPEPFHAPSPTVQ